MSDDERYDECIHGRPVAGQCEECLDLIRWGQTRVATDQISAAVAAEAAKLIGGEEVDGE